MFARHRAASDRGAAAVELALLMPILAVLLFGIAQLGLALSAKVSVTHAAREGARLAAVGASNGEVIAAAKARAGALDAALVQVSVGPASREIGDPVTVTVSYPFSAFGLGPLPVPGPQAGTASANNSLLTKTLTSTAIMRAEARVP